MLFSLLKKCLVSCGILTVVVLYFVYGRVALDGPYYNKRGMKLLEEGCFDKALENFDRAI